MLTTVGLYGYGIYLGMQGIDQGIGPPPKAPAFGPYYWLGLDPCVWGLAASLASGVIVSLFTPPPDHARVSLLFDLQPPDAVAPATAAIHPERFHEEDAPSPSAPEPESSS